MGGVDFLGVAVVVAAVVVAEIPELTRDTFALTTLPARCGSVVSGVITVTPAQTRA